MYIGYYWWILIPAMLFTMYASGQVKSNYKKYAQIKNARGLTGLQVAESILRANQIYDVKILRGSGQLTDHYNPKNRTVVLSPHVYDGDSIASASIAAHECGHVMQHCEAYAPLSFRSLLVGPTQIASKAAPFIILISLFVFRGNSILLDIGILAYVVIVLFHVVTLPVEFNASSRAVKAMAEGQLVYDEDLPGTKKVLNAAALTYVAAMLAALLSLVRLLLIRGRRN